MKKLPTKFLEILVLIRQKHGVRAILQRKYYIKQLKNKKVIRRVGTTHKGYWEII